MRRATGLRGWRGAYQPAIGALIGVVAARKISRSWRSVLSPRGCSAPSCRAFRVRATPESAEYLGRSQADRLRRSDAANEGRPPCAAPRLSPPAELARRRRLTISATGKQPALFVPAQRRRGRPRLPPLPQQVEDLGRKHHVPVLAAFRLDNANDHLLTVDVVRSQPHRRLKLAVQFCQRRLD